MNLILLIPLIEFLVLIAVFIRDTKGYIWKNSYYRKHAKLSCMIYCIGFLCGELGMFKIITEPSVRDILSICTASFVLVVPLLVFLELRYERYQLSKEIIVKTNNSGTN